MNNHDDHLCRSKNCSSCHSILSVIGSIRYIRFRWFDWVSPLMIVMKMLHTLSNQMSLSWNATFWHKKISNKHWNSMFNVWYFASSWSCHVMKHFSVRCNWLNAARPTCSLFLSLPGTWLKLCKIKLFDQKILFPKPPCLRPVRHSQKIFPAIGGCKMQPGFWKITAKSSMWCCDCGMMMSSPPPHLSIKSCWCCDCDLMSSPPPHLSIKSYWCCDCDMLSSPPPHLSIKTGHHNDWIDWSFVAVFWWPRSHHPTHVPGLCLLPTPSLIIGTTFFRVFRVVAAMAKKKID